MKFRPFIFLVTTLAALSPVRLAMAAETGTAPTPAAVAAQAAMKELLKTPPAVVDGYLKLGFDRLAAYPYILPAFDPTKAKPPTGEEQIPAEVKSWSGRKVILTGFMMPVKMKDGLVTEFLLVKDPLVCCFGSVPNINEWVVVKMKQGVQALMDMPMAFYGQLKVGAVVENNYISGIYFLEGEKMTDVQD